MARPSRASSSRPFRTSMKSAPMALASRRSPRRVPMRRRRPPPKRGLKEASSSLMSRTMRRSAVRLATGWRRASSQMRQKLPSFPPVASKDVGSPETTANPRLRGMTDCRRLRPGLHAGRRRARSLASRSTQKERAGSRALASSPLSAMHRARLPVEGEWVRASHDQRARAERRKSPRRSDSSAVSARRESIPARRASRALSPPPLSKEEACQASSRASRGQTGPKCSSKRGRWMPRSTASTSEKRRSSPERMMSPAIWRLRCMPRRGRWREGSRTGSSPPSIDSRGPALDASRAGSHHPRP